MQAMDSRITETISAVVDASAVRGKPTLADGEASAVLLLCRDDGVSDDLTGVAGAPSWAISSTLRGATLHSSAAGTSIGTVIAPTFPGQNTAH
jgi:hypothetical protein